MNNAEKVAENIRNRYQERTCQSAKYYKTAKEHLPGGETREATAFKPYPTFMERGQGFSLFDYDGNEYLDFLGNYTSLVHGHCDPDITAAVSEQLTKGSMLGSVSPHLIEHAKLICQRVPSADMVRYTNSGTEATMWAIRAARAVTGKDKILKIEGGYHGTFDAAKVSVIPDFDPQGLPKPHLEGLGIPQSVLNDVLVAPFNDLEAVDTLLLRNVNQVAAIITEPFLGNVGVIPPEDGYLKGLRELADKHGVLLIFDEVQSFRLSTGGMQLLSGVTPDLCALGKLIGGGYPVGAFAGSKAIMDRFEFNIVNPDTINHSGTFNGNEVSMVAGIASIKKLDQMAIDHINSLGEKLRNEMNEYFQSAGIKCQFLGMGSLSNLAYTDQVINNTFDFVMAYVTCIELQSLFHLELINRGIFSAKRGEFIISTPMSENEIDICTDQIKQTFDVLRPYIEEKTPHLIR